MVVILSLTNTSREILSPTSINQVSNVIAHDQLVRKAWLGARVDHDRALCKPDDVDDTVVADA